MIKLKVSLLLLSIAVLVSSCGFNNTMYNAKKYFKEAQAEPLNANGRPNNTAIDKYTKTIKKCGYILTERKRSKIIDDALFLMAKALYYKGNSQFQAKDQFENIIKNFPDSPFVPESYIFLARINSEINKTPEAKSILQDFVRKQEYYKYHVPALLLLTDLEIKDKQYLKAQFWLEKIVSEYPKSPSFNDAFFRLGQILYEQQNYNQSLQEFTRLSKKRGLSAEFILDIDLYRTRNYFYLKDYDKALKLLKSINKNETRSANTSEAAVIAAKILYNQNQIDEAEKAFNDILKKYARTNASAEACYYLGEIAYYYKRNPTDALSFYNRVKSELQTAPVCGIAKSKYDALTQIRSGISYKYDNNPQQFVDYYINAGANFAGIFNLPDSSLAYYGKILEQKPTISALIDTQRVAVRVINTTIDSLQQQLDMFEQTPVIDSTLIVADSTQIQHSHQSEIKVDQAAITRKLDNLRSEKKITEQRLSNLNSLLQRLDNEYIPFTYFVIASQYIVNATDSTKVHQILELMQQQYPQSKYTNGVKQLVNNEPLRLIDILEENQERTLDEALGLTGTNPDSMAVILLNLLDSPYSAIKQKAIFRLGFYYTFERPDSAQAFKYFDNYLKLNATDDYSTFIRRIFDGTKFIAGPFVPEKKDVADDSLNVDQIKSAVEDSLAADNGKDKEESEPLLEEKSEQSEDTSPTPITPSDEEKPDVLPPPPEPLSPTPE